MSRSNSFPIFCFLVSVRGYTCPNSNTARSACTALSDLRQPSSSMDSLSLSSESLYLFDFDNENALDFSISQAQAEILESLLKNTESDVAEALIRSVALAYYFSQIGCVSSTTQTPVSAKIASTSAIAAAKAAQAFVCSPFSAMSCISASNIFAD